MIRKKIFKIAILLVAVVATSPVMALDSDRRQPIEIEANQGSLDQANQVTIFTGNVVIKQGTLNIRASSVRVSRDKQGQQSMSATGGPVYFSQTLDGSKGTVKGQANQVEYSSATGMVKLVGNAKVQRDNDRAEGAVITYNTRTEVYSVNGSSNAAGSGKRVTVVIQPPK